VLSIIEKINRFSPLVNRNGAFGSFIATILSIKIVVMSWGVGKRLLD
jgi:hypothetical protein